MTMTDTRDAGVQRLRACAAVAREGAGCAGVRVPPGHGAS